MLPRIVICSQDITLGSPNRSLTMLSTAMTRTLVTPRQSEIVVHSDDPNYGDMPPDSGDAKGGYPPDSGDTS